MTEVTDEQVERAARAIERDVWGVTIDCAPNSLACRTARAALEAAQGPERPKWPTDESLNFWLDPDGRPLSGSESDTAADVRHTLRASMLADPIVKSAVALARDLGSRGSRCSGDVILSTSEDALRNAVHDARLLGD